MKPTKQTVYLPVNGEQEKVVCHDYPDWMDTISGVIEEEGYFFTAKQLNEYTQNVIKQALETAAENAETKIEESYAGSLGNAEGKLYDEVQIVDKQSITNTFKEILKRFEV